MSTEEAIRIWKAMQSDNISAALSEVADDSVAGEILRFASRWEDIDYLMCQLRKHLEGPR